MADNVIPFPRHRRGRVPTRRPRPGVARTYRLRIALVGVRRPEIWREVEVDSTLTLDRLHLIVQLAFGWTDSRLHQWINGAPWPEPGLRNERFTLDVPDFEDWPPAAFETDVHLDELLQEAGDPIWYEYDMRDGWMHEVTLVGVSDGTPPSARVVAGENARPPEGIGGPAIYQRLLDLASGRDRDQGDSLSAAFHQIWPGGVIGQRIDLDKANRLLATNPTSMLDALQPWRRTARPDVVAFLDQIGHDPDRTETIELYEHVRASARPVDPPMAAAATEQLRWLLRFVGDGLSLTPAKYLLPADVVAVSEAWHLEKEWFDLTDREVDLYPMRAARQALQNVGLLRAVKGRLTRTRAGVALTDDPVGLWTFLAARMPGRCRSSERDATFAYLLAVAAEVADPEMRAARMMAAIGWRAGGEIYSKRLILRDAGITMALLIRLGSYEEGTVLASDAITPVGVAFARAVLTTTR